MPLVSEAFAVILRLDPAAILLPLLGLVMATVGVKEPVFKLDGKAMLIVAGADVTTTPLLSVAWAVMV